MLPVIFQLDIFGDRQDFACWRYSQDCLIWMLECLVNCNRSYLRLYPSTPKLYKSGVRYAREHGTEDWSGIKVCKERMYGDCEDLGCWRAAELREFKREPARPYLKFKRVNGFWQYHIQVLRYKQQGNKWLPAGIEDPSQKLGMNAANEMKPLNLNRSITTGV